MDAGLGARECPFVGARSGLRSVRAMWWASCNRSNAGHWSGQVGVGFEFGYAKDKKKSKRRRATWAPVPECGTDAVPQGR